MTKSFGYSEILDFLLDKKSDIVFDQKYISKYYKSDKNVRNLMINTLIINISKVFKDLCVIYKKCICINIRYNFYVSVICFWKELKKKVFLVARKITDCFYNDGLPGFYGKEKQDFFSKIIMFGYRNWCAIVIEFNLIENGLNSTQLLCEANPSFFPFDENGVFALILNIVDNVINKDNEYNAVYMTFVKHYLSIVLHYNYFYIQNNKSVISDTIKLIDVLDLYKQYNKSLYDLTLSNIKKHVLILASKNKNNYREETSIYFQNYVFQEILKMEIECDYIQSDNLIIDMINLIEKLCIEEVNFDHQPLDVFARFLEKRIKPIVSVCYDFLGYFGTEYVERFSKMFFEKVLLRSAAKDISKTLSSSNLDLYFYIKGNDDLKYLVSREFYKIYHAQTCDLTRFNDTNANNQQISQIINKMKTEVKNNFQNDPYFANVINEIILLNNKQIDVVNKRLIQLIDGINHPSSQKILFYEFSNLVKYLDDKLYVENICNYIISKLLTAFKPNTNLEIELIKIIQRECTIPVNFNKFKFMIEDFKKNYTYQDQCKNMKEKPQFISVCILRYDCWNSIVPVGELNVFSEYNTYKELYLHFFRKVIFPDYNIKLHWCDYISLVEVFIKLEEFSSPKLFLLNGIQYSLLRYLSNTDRTSYKNIQNNYRGHFHVTNKALKSLLEEGLVIKNSDKTYSIAKNFTRNRNLTSKYLKIDPEDPINIDIKTKNKINASIVKYIKQKENATALDINDFVINDLMFYKLETQQIETQLFELKNRGIIEFNSISNIYSLHN